MRSGGEVSPRHCCVRPVPPIPPTHPIPPVHPIPHRGWCCCSIIESPETEKSCKIKTKPQSSQVQTASQGQQRLQPGEGTAARWGLRPEQHGARLSSANGNGWVVLGALWAPGGVKTCRLLSHGREQRGAAGMGHLCPLSRSAVPRALQAPGKGERRHRRPSARGMAQIPHRLRAHRSLEAAAFWDRSRVPLRDDGRHPRGSHPCVPSSAPNRGGAR